MPANESGLLCSETADECESQPTIAEQCLHGPTYLKSRGYRLVAATECNVADGPDILAETVDCPDRDDNRSMSGGTIVLILFIVILLFIVAFIVAVCWTKRPTAVYEHLDLLRNRIKDTIQSGKSPFIVVFFSGVYKHVLIFIYFFVSLIL